MTLDPWWKPTRPVADRSLVITGTSTDVGKTIVTAALAATLAAAGTDVAVCKPAQTGVGPDEPGDLATVTALAGDLPTWEGARFPDPLAPETAAHRGHQDAVVLRSDEMLFHLRFLSCCCCRKIVALNGTGFYRAACSPDADASPSSSSSFGVYSHLINSSWLIVSSGASSSSTGTGM